MFLKDQSAVRRMDCNGLRMEQRNLLGKCCFFSSLGFHTFNLVSSDQKFFTSIPSDPHTLNSNSRQILLIQSFRTHLDPVDGQPSRFLYQQHLLYYLTFNRLYTSCLHTHQCQVQTVTYVKAENMSILLTDISPLCLGQCLGHNKYLLNFE